MGLCSDHFRMEYEGNSIEVEGRARLVFLFFSSALLGAVKGIGAAPPDVLQKEMIRYRLFINQKRVDKTIGGAGTFLLRGQLRAENGVEGKAIAVQIKQGLFRCRAFLEVDGHSIRMTRVRRMDGAECLVWLFGGGLLMGLVWWLAGIIMFCTVIGIPWGRVCFPLGTLALFPFGREAVSRKELQRRGNLVGKIIWFLFGGLWLALGHSFFALLCAATLFGIPFAIQHLKLARVALAPVGKTIINQTGQNKGDAGRVAQLVDA